MKEPKSVVSLAIGGLAIVNVALAVALWAHSSEPTAYAQQGGRPDIIVVSARNAVANQPHRDPLSCWIPIPASSP